MRAIVAEVLTCVYQSTIFMKLTREAACKIAGAVGANFHEFDVEPLVQNRKNLQKQSLVESLVGKAMILHAKNSGTGASPRVWLIAIDRNIRCNKQSIRSCTLRNHGRRHRWGIRANRRYRQSVSARLACMD